MSQDFVADDDNFDPPVSPQNSAEMPPNREQLKHLLIGSPKGIRSTIQNLQVRGYAETTQWSPLMPTEKPGEVMSMLIRYIQRQ
jgi:DNA topoisomerase IA